jgi:hypothetical protein
MALMRPSETLAMSDQSIASIARSLAAALLAEAAKRDAAAEEEEKRRVAALEAALCAEYRDEVFAQIKL